MPRRKRVPRGKTESPIVPKQCSICLDTISVRGLLPICDHNFCYECIYEWSKNTNTCPLCKQRFRCIKKINLVTNSPLRQVRVADKDQSEHYADEYIADFEDFDISSSIDTVSSDEDSFINDDSDSESSDDGCTPNYQLRHSTRSSSLDLSVIPQSPPPPLNYLDDEDVIKPIRLRPFHKRYIGSPASSTDVLLTSSPINLLHRTARPLVLSDEDDETPVTTDKWLTCRKRPFEIKLTKSDKRRRLYS